MPPGPPACALRRAAPRRRPRRPLAAPLPGSGRAPRHRLPPLVVVRWVASGGAAPAAVRGRLRWRAPLHRAAPSRRAIRRRPAWRPRGAAARASARPAAAPAPAPVAARGVRARAPPGGTWLRAALRCGRAAACGAARRVAPLPALPLAPRAAPAAVAARRAAARRRLSRGAVSCAARRCQLRCDARPRFGRAAGGGRACVRRAAASSALARARARRPPARGWVRARSCARWARWPAGRAGPGAGSKEALRGGGCCRRVPDSGQSICYRVRS